MLLELAVLGLSQLGHGRAKARTELNWMDGWRKIAMPVRRSLRALCQSPQRPQAAFMGTGSRRARPSSHSPADDMKQRECDFHSASDGKRAKGITYISGSRIFSALEVAGDVFSRADVGQQLVELRRRAL